ncbi:carboxypeptidase-like regulatory domain-containing protein [Edaphobacter bradus]|uniref:carboxypeptidase-like regulatory domain-containing protein n=1 Tax=Edaphobacter bradus TaxID=2259016 RepID=UPI0021DF8292|nr:carboxypeptidase-like regulatory domain-containing protein [Edaphobacter bradus]
MLRLTCSLAALVSFALTAAGQQAAQPPVQNVAKPIYGSVTGRVTCENNVPARLASVTLLPITDAPDSRTPTQSDGRSQQLMLTPVDTGLDGSFTMPRVTPGYYYVVVEYPGYISPTAQLTSDDLAHPSLEMQKFIASVLPTVAVDPNRISNIDIQLRRGASISGFIRYDDGSPAPGLNIRVRRKDSSGKWVGVRIQSVAGKNRPASDDQGRYRIVGLPAGEYILETSLEVSENYITHLFDSATSSGGSSSGSTKFGIRIYSGGETRQRNATHIKLNDGEDDSNEDIVIPISKLHSVTGGIVQARTGRVVNAGTAVLLYPDDNSEAASAKVDKDDSTFRFDFVPEGNYILKVTNARDVSREEIPNGPPGTFPPTHTKETTIKTYGPQQQPIVIAGDMTGVAIAVPDEAATSKAAQ